MTELMAGIPAWASLWFDFKLEKKKSSDLIEFKFLIGFTAGGNYTNCFFEQNPRRMENLESGSIFYKQKCCRGSSAEFWGAPRD